MAVAQANIASAQAQLEEAQAQGRRTLTLFRKGVAARAALDRDLVAVRVAEASLRAAEQELAKGQSGAREEEIDAQIATIQGLEAQLRAARDAQGDTALVAPFAGIVSERHVESFANVGANEPIVTLQSLDNLDLSFDLPGPDVTRLAAAEDVTSTVVFDAVPGQSFPAELVEFSTQADAQTQTFRGRVRPEDVVILPGMSARLVATVPASSDGVSIPEGAVMAAPDGSALVWVVDDEGAVAQRAVTLGEAHGGAVTVKDGLADGERVVTAGIYALKPGMAVRPVTAIED